MAASPLRSEIGSAGLLCQRMAGGIYRFTRRLSLVLLVLYAAIFFRGGGRLSVDKMLGKEF
jgi:hypothetical protein